MISVLLKNSRKIAINTFRTQTKTNYFSYLIVAAVFGFITYFLSSLIFTMSESISADLFGVILSYGFLLIIGFLILVGVPQIFKQLYSASDLDLLFTMPISTKHIFLVKFIESFMGVPLFMFILLSVPLYLYGISISAAFLYYPVVALVLLAILTIGLSIAYWLNLLIIQIVPKGKINEYMTVMSMFSGVIVYFMFNGLTSNLAIGKSIPSLPQWLPVTWGSNAVVDVINGSDSFLTPFVLLMILAAFFAFVTLTLVDKGFRVGWIQMNESGGRKKKSKAIKKEHKLRHPIIAIGKKEGLTIKRDMREWLQYAPFLFIIIILFNVLTNLEDIGYANDATEISWPIAQVLLLIIAALIMGDISSATISRESRSLWFLRVLPLSGRDIAIGKLWISWLVPFLLITFIEIFVSVLSGWSIIQLLSGIVMKGLFTIGMSSIGLWFGTVGAKFNPNKPLMRVKFGVAIIMMISSYLYLFIALMPYLLLVLPMNTISFFEEVSLHADGLFGFIATIIYTSLTWRETNPIVMHTMMIGVMVVFSIGISYVFIMASARKIDKGINIEIVHESNAKSLLNKSKMRL